MKHVIPLCREDAYRESVFGEQNKVVGAQHGPSLQQGLRLFGVADLCKQVRHGAGIGRGRTANVHGYLRGVVYRKMRPHSEHAMERTRPDFSKSAVSQCLEASGVE